MLRTNPARALLASVAVPALALLAACGASSGGTTSTTAGATPAASTRTQAAASRSPSRPDGPVTIPGRPKKIVSLSPTATESLFAIGAGPQVVAVDDQSNHPAEAPRTDLSGFKPNAEAIIAKKPDLVVLANDDRRHRGRAVQGRASRSCSNSAATKSGRGYDEIADLGAGHRQQGQGRRRSPKGRSGRSASSRCRLRRGRSSVYHELDATSYSATATPSSASLRAVRADNIADKAAEGANGGYPKLSGEYVGKAAPT